MTKDREILICSKAIENFGQARQILQAMEELGELQQALARFLEDREHNVEEEVADVEIMLNQLKIMFNWSDINKWREKKLIRLENRIYKPIEEEKEAKTC